ncbi:hypothetical protein D9M68_363050 [compost metagenome]
MGERRRVAFVAGVVGEYRAFLLRVAVAGHHAATGALQQGVEQVGERHLPVVLPGDAFHHRDHRHQPRAGHLLQAEFAQGGVVAAVVADLVQGDAGEDVVAGRRQRMLLAGLAGIGLVGPGQPVADLRVAGEQQHLTVRQLEGQHQAGVVGVGVHLQRHGFGAVQPFPLDAPPDIGFGEVELLDALVGQLRPAVPRLVDGPLVGPGERQFGDQRFLAQFAAGAVLDGESLFQVGEVDLLAGAFRGGVLAQPLLAARRPHDHGLERRQAFRTQHVARLQEARGAAAGLFPEQVDGGLARAVHGQRLDERGQRLHRADARVAHGQGVELHDLGQRRLGAGEALAQGGGLRVVGVLGPGQPEFVDVEGVAEEALLLVAEAGEVVVVLVGQHHQVEVAAGDGLDVVDDGLHPVARAFHALQHAAVDEDMARLAGFVVAEQEAVAEYAAVHAHRDVAAGGFPHGIRLPGGSWRRGCRCAGGRGRSGPASCCR